MEETTEFHRGFEISYMKRLRTTIMSRCHMLPIYGLSAVMAALLAVTANAQDGLEIIGVPKNGGMGFQPSATELARDIQWLDGLLLVIITAIVVFVCALLLFCIFRYNGRANPNPAKFTHNSSVEVAWTVIPILILVFIAVPSLQVLFKQTDIPEGDVHIKATGNQWYWGYEYTDHDFGFESFMIGDGKILTDEVVQELEAAGYSRDEFLLATDTAVVVPVNKVVVMTITGADVIHAWTIPAFGVKQDAVPGRLAQLWFKAEKEGVYFGQCSELCGKDHAYMPITVKVVSQEEYDKWLSGAITEYAGTPAEIHVAMTK